jgi:Sulfotransferase domain
MDAELRMTQSAPANAPSTRASTGIVWLASFPKSGNTWTRSFLHNLIKVQQAGETGEQDINAMGRFSTWDILKNRYTDILGFEPSTDHRDQIAATRQKVQQQIADETDGIVFVKTHNALVMDRGYTTINTAVTSGAVYIVRNPLDVAISYAHHMSRSIDEAITLMGTENMETQVTEKAIYEVYGSWSQHVSSWTSRPHRAIFVMRYEDMLREPAKTFSALARHLLLYFDEAQLAEAIELSSFKKLREQENTKGFREKPPKADRFFRDGTAGQWQSQLTDKQIKRVVDEHREQMTRFGYIGSDGTLAVA